MIAWPYHKIREGVPASCLHIPTYCSLLHMYLLVISFLTYASHLTQTNDLTIFTNFCFSGSFQVVFFFLVLTLPIPLGPWFSSIPHRSNTSTIPYGFLLGHCPPLKFACSKGGIMFAYLFRYGSGRPIFSFCIFCLYSLQNWEKALGIGVGDKGVCGSRPWFEGLGGPLSEAKHCGAGDPWCLLGSSPRSMRSRADHGRVRWLVEGGIFIPGRGDWTFISGPWGG